MTPATLRMTLSKHLKTPKMIGAQTAKQNAGFFHPDYTVGAGILPARPFGSRTRSSHLFQRQPFTASGDFHPALKQISLFSYNWIIHFSEIIARKRSLYYGYRDLVICFYKAPISQNTSSPNAPSISRHGRTITRNADNSMANLSSRVISISDIRSLNSSSSSFEAFLNLLQIMMLYLEDFFSVRTASNRYAPFSSILRSGKWQATKWPGSTSRNGGGTRLHSSHAI